ncbi:MAG: hypothetical protein Q9M31_04680 [Mariprofundus sp.]|nr:hypothetical protein [Mariprofundus sp.]
MKVDHRRKWDQKYLLAPALVEQPPSTFLSENMGFIKANIPINSTVLDLAAGEGRNAIFWPVMDLRASEINNCPVMRMIRVRIQGEVFGA